MQSTFSEHNLSTLAGVAPREHGQMHVLPENEAQLAVELDRGMIRIEYVQKRSFRARGDGSRKRKYKLSREPTYLCLATVPVPTVCRLAEVAGSAKYLERAGSPATPTDLTQHRIIGGSAAAVPSAWAFERGSERVAVDLQPHLSTNENEGAIAAAAAGLGITSTSEWACRRELEGGSLVRLFTDWKTADIPVHAYFPMGPATRAAARALVDHLVAQFQLDAIHAPHA